MRARRVSGAMAEYDARALEINKRLISARMDLLSKNPFYALLLMRLKFAIDFGTETAYTDGTRVAFSPDFMDTLSDGELEFVLMHEVLHVALLHCFRTQPSYDPYLFNIACDIVVNSNILYSNNMDIAKISLQKYGALMHLTPSGEEGYKYTAEEVYRMLIEDASMASVSGGGSSGDGKPSSSSGKRHGDESGGSSDSSSGGSDKNKKGAKKGAADGNFDDHTRWHEDPDGIKKAEWRAWCTDAASTVDSMGAPGQRGAVPLGAHRMIDEIRDPILDWREVLQNFIDEDVTDYSFSPPDRRFYDTPFFLPDYNETEESVEDILFMIDASASMSRDMLTGAYSEVCGALTRFGGRLRGWLGFFDADLAVEPFTDTDEFKFIKPRGGGGTSFHIIFNYVREKMYERRPKLIIILTDGYAPFPDERDADGIPVLWLINNEKVNPPFGKVARIIDGR